MIRENGYYRVKFQDRDSEPEWIIMEWNSMLNEFILNGEYGYEDDDLIEIDERRIVRNKSNEPDFSIQPPELN